MFPVPQQLTMTKSFQRIYAYFVYVIYKRLLIPIVRFNFSRYNVIDVNI